MLRRVTMESISRCLLYLAAIFALVASESPRAEKYTALNPCISKQTCGECIRTSSCSWCYAENFLKPRCFLPTPDNISGGCSEEFVYAPKSEHSEMINKPLSRGNAKEYGGGSQQGIYEKGTAAGTTAKNIVQVSPQVVSVNLRMNEAKKFSVFYSQAEDNPVDLYYLMDLSKSMENDKEKLSILGNLLAETMQKLTSNFRLGFGSFVDKTVMPYISTIREKMEHPCPGCAAPYGFKNDMPLSNDTHLFSEAVQRASVSGNLDSPEGGFDAIMQAVVCPDIGWRPEARKLLVFSTDAGFHFAGDGKLGGIIKPNDGECHLDMNNPADHYEYTKQQDYPSVSQINLKVKKNAINMIFAVTQDQINVYKQLEQHIEGATSGVLSEDSSNVVDLVREHYNKITSAVTMKDNAMDAIKVTYYSSCLTNGPLQKTNRCDGLKVGDKVEFQVEIELLECPADKSKWNQSFQIYPVGVGESLTIDLQMLCDCPCERPGNPFYEPFSYHCSGVGTYACGVCECGTEHFGRNCECSASGGSNNTSNTDSCRPPGHTGGPCSDRGNCICGQCECNTPGVITGPYCECDNLSCDRRDSLLCSGDDHGTCVCGHCQCKSGWSGDDCSCRTLNDTCIYPGNGLICNGHGRCECGVCVCDARIDDDNVYTGQYCHECRTCTHKCEEFKACVLCQHFHQGLSEEECNKTCQHYNIVPKETLTQEDSNSYICTYLDENDCRYSYKYERGSSVHSYRTVYIEVQDKLDCPPPVFILGIVLGVIAAIVLIGLALLMLWKMVTTIHDRREFARFEKERAMAKWDTGENPIYKQATTTFKNPIYQGK